MRVAVCTSCKVKLVSGNKVKETADLILKNHKNHWESDINAPIGFQDWEVVDPNTSYVQFVLKNNNNQ